MILSLNIRVTSEAFFPKCHDNPSHFTGVPFYTSSLELGTFGFCISHFAESEGTAQCGFDLYQNNNDFEDFS